MRIRSRWLIVPVLLGIGVIIAFWGHRFLHWSVQHGYLEPPGIQTATQGLVNITSWSETKKFFGTAPPWPEFVGAFAPQQWQGGDVVLSYGQMCSGITNTPRFNWLNQTLTLQEGAVGALPPPSSSPVAIVTNVTMNLGPGSLKTLEQIIPSCLTGSNIHDSSLHRLSVSPPLWAAGAPGNVLVVGWHEGWIVSLQLTGQRYAAGANPTQTPTTNSTISAGIQLMHQYFDQRGWHAEAGT